MRAAGSCRPLDPSPRMDSGERVTNIARILQTRVNHHDRPNRSKLIKIGQDSRRPKSPAAENLAIFTLFSHSFPRMTNKVPT